MSLRGTLAISLFVALAIAGAAAIAVVVVTAHMHRSAAYVGIAMEDVQLAEECLVDLRAIEALRARAESAPSPSRELERLITTRIEGLRSHLVAIDAGHLHAPAAAALRGARAAVDRYLLREVPVGAVAWDPADGARAALRCFVELHLADAREEKANAARLDHAADVFGLFAVAVLLGGSVVLGGLLRRMLFDPLLAITTGISRYTRGDRISRVPEVGAEELREIARSFNKMADTIEDGPEGAHTSMASLAPNARN